jgi:hypothetical protein
MPYSPNTPNYQTKNSRVLSFNDFEEHQDKEEKELKKINRNFIKPDAEHNQMIGNPASKFNRVSRKYDTLHKDEVEDDLDQFTDDPKHVYKAEIPTQQSSLKNESSDTKNYMFFSNLETIRRLSESLLQMDRKKLDSILDEHDWASDHIATSKDDVEEVFNFFKSMEKETSDALKHPTERDDRGGTWMAGVSRLQ